MHRLLTVLCLLWLLTPSMPAFAGAKFNNYHRTSWNAEAGVGSVENIQQTPDGFLWLTTSLGVLRFDGVKFQTLDEVTGGLVKGGDIDSVFVSRSGGIWLATRTSGMVLFKEGKVTSFSNRTCSPSHKENGIAEATDGSLWIQARSGLAHLAGTKCEQLGPNRGYPGGWVAGILADHSGAVWILTQPGHLLRVSPGNDTPHEVRAIGTTLPSVYLHEGPNGSIWVADDRGLRIIEPLSNRPAVDAKDGRLKSPLGDFRFAGDGSLWAGMPGGLTHLSSEFIAQQHRPITGSSKQDVVYSAEAGAGTIQSVLIDREGNIWTGSSDGLDRFRATPLHALIMPVKQDGQLAVATANDSKFFLGGRSLSLTSFDKTGKSQVFGRLRLITLLFRDATDTLWIGSDSRLWRWSAGRLTQIHYPTEERNGICSVGIDRNGDLWVLLFGGGTYYQHGGTWQDQNPLLGRKPGVLGAMASDADGNIWLAFSNHLVRWNGFSYDHFSFPDGRLNVSVYALYANRERVWMAGSGGVLLFENGKFQLLRCSDADLPGRVTGVLETTSGDLWTNGFSGVMHVPAAEVQKWKSDPGYVLHAERLDAADGLPGLATDRTPMSSLVQGTDGRLWFATSRSVAWLNPKGLAALRNTLAPNVVVQAIRVDGTAHPIDTVITLKPRARNIQIDFTALSLSMPERMHFMYRLTGFDQSWQDAQGRREAFYTALPPGAYTFEVRASNNDGVWSESPTAQKISVLPAYYQTVWFRALGVAAIACLLLLLARAHSNRVSADVRLRMTERLHERERIARELHDTLLQSLAGLMLHFQTAASKLPNGDQTRAALESALERSDKVMHEGRERVRYLRANASDSGQLTFSIENMGNQFSSISRAQFVLQVKGRPRELRSIVQEEILLIVREALTNAFTHAQASEIVAEINYLSTALLISVTDDGCGIDSVIYEAGSRPGHWGLSGMRERARKLQCSFSVKTSGGGTKVALRLSARVAYDGAGKWVGRIRHALYADKKNNV